MKARLSAVFTIATAIAACATPARLPVTSGTGAAPVLPAAQESALPLINVVKRKGWTTGRTPAAARGTSVSAFATDLDHPRWIYVLPNGDVLVAETNAPDRSED